MVLLLSTAKLRSRGKVNPRAPLTVNSSDVYSFRGGIIIRWKQTKTSILTFSLPSSKRENILSEVVGIGS